MARYGRVTFSISYAVDLDDQEMISEAKELIVEDVAGMRHNEIRAWIDVAHDQNATREEIAEVLIEHQNWRRNGGAVAE